MQIKYCKICEKELPITNFYNNGTQLSGRKKYKPNCKSCQKTIENERFHSRLIEFFGKYECCVCRYNNCFPAIEFHHTNPSAKDYDISSMKTHSKENLFRELSKGILLCANCHRETHYGLHPELLSC